MRNLATQDINFGSLTNDMSVTPRQNTNGPQGYVHIEKETSKPGFIYHYFESFKIGSPNIICYI